MNCERVEELLIVFMEGDADSAERESVERHLDSCRYCSKKLEEYREIKALFAKETLPQPSLQVLTALSKTAREELNRDNPSFWKKWFYSPILVPVMSSALALFLWISYGEDNAKIFSDNKDVYSSREVMAEKLHEKPKPNLSGVSEEKSEDSEPESGGVLSGKPSSVSRQDSGERDRIQAAAPEPLSKELFYGSDMEETNKTPEYRDEASAALESKSIGKSLSQQPAETEDIVQPEAQTEMQVEEEKEIVKRERVYSFKSDYDDRLNIALEQQSKGDCEASIRTSEELINSSPSPPDSVKEKAYLSLAECYEQKEKWEAAILNYRNLEELASEQADFAKEKIEVLERKNALLKTR